MSNISEIQRGLFSEAGISLYDFNRGTLPRREFPKLSNAAGPYAESNIWVDDTPGITPLQIESKCNWIKTQTGLDLIVIDYLQLMRADGRHESRRHELEYISRELKLIAKRFSVPVIALSQLSRKVEERKPARPMLSDLRESGAIEQDADIVLFMYRPEYYEKTTDKKGITELIIGKQRNGRTGYIEIYFDESAMRFKDLVKDTPEQWQND
jgi:replicative DNA helicase